jgi:hypothetical protein
VPVKLAPEGVSQECLTSWGANTAIKHRARIRRTDILPAIENPFNM